MLKIKKYAVVVVVFIFLLGWAVFSVISTEIYDSVQLNVKGTRRWRHAAERSVGRLTFYDCVGFANDNHHPNGLSVRVLSIFKYVLVCDIITLYKFFKIMFYILSAAKSIGFTMTFFFCYHFFKYIEFFAIFTYDTLKDR